VVHAGRGSCPVQGTADVALVDGACVAGREDQALDVVGPAGAALLLPVAPRLEFDGDLGAQRDRAS